MEHIQVPVICQRTSQFTGRSPRPSESDEGQIRPYDDIPAMSGLTTSGHPHITTEGLKSARTGREQRQQHAVRGRQSYSITSSARSRNPGIVTPSALAVVRLMMSIELGRLP